MSSINLPVSLGEAIDKLTILDIKLARIMDSRREHVQVEYSMLYEKLAPSVEQYRSLYESMKKINSIIWDDMDVLRDGTLSEADYFKICKKTIVYNDIRFRIKNKINTVSGSLLKEQKGYKVNSILIELNEALSSIDDFIRPIRYYSFLYDQVVISYKGSLEIESLFAQDPTIMFVRCVDSNISFKENFSFMNRDYSKSEILDLFKINDDMMNDII
jgi:hypothetical protein